VEFPNVVAYAVPFFSLAVLLEVIAWRTGHGARYETRDSAVSLTMGFFHFIVAAPLAVAVGAAFEWGHRFAIFDIGYEWWAFGLCFFLEDQAYYWFHRVSHRCRWFWASHIIHHSSQHYNLSTALRQTWTGNLTLAFVFWMPLLLLGFPPEMVILFRGTSLVYQFWIHTEVIDRMGACEWVFNTPSHHRVHHATNPRYLDANYAGVLVVWDRLFGSFVAETAEDPPTYGIVKNLGTFNPLRVAFHEWVAILRDLRGSNDLHERLQYAFRPPGWSPDGSRRTTEMIQDAWRARQAAISVGSEGM
jgi:sterol desaturase/sphingolipid hydroxylase (fatty acid hydroxylase superfamily)